MHMIGDGEVAKRKKPRNDKPERQRHGALKVSNHNCFGEVAIFVTFYIIEFGSEAQNRCSPKQEWLQIYLLHNSATALQVTS